MRRYVAFDLGAESGRALLATLEKDALAIQELHRFPNEPVSAGGAMHWDILRLWHEMKRGLALAPEIDSVGVDTWGVDFALLDDAGALMQNPIHYRDPRTDGVPERVFEIVSPDEIYENTGVQFMQINTLFQMYALVRKHPDLVRAARHFLTIPDLLNYWLTGQITCEYTNATTTQMFDTRARDWARPMLAKLGIPTLCLEPVVEPGTVIGALRPELGRAQVVAPACHDTGSAVAAIEASGSTAFISSGTWSLMGTEAPAPVVTPEARSYNFTNEGGVGGTTRVLKNIMGMWLLQACRKQWQTVDYASIVAMAKTEPDLLSLVDPDDASFLHPQDMCAAIREFCAGTQQPVPETQAAYVQTIFESLALKYRYVLESLSNVTGRKYRRIRVVGGGARNRVLNQYLADATGCRVFAGPVEATALGNVVMQLVATGVVPSIAAGREIVARSFPPDVFEPRDSSAWDKAYPRFVHFVETATSAHRA
ncbi:MAG TPA: rhamnulokinase family protein [Bryobacteraceae bacterium]|nr:rhamnulokinase family protein [Bryobacteraceae bacterium]